MTASSENVTFPNAAGARLAGRLERPLGDIRGWAIFAHCFACSKNSHAAVRVSRRLAELGIATLRFDFAGLGASAGDFETTSFTSNIEDLEAAAAYLEAEHEAPSLLIGHSWGGAASIVAATRLASVRAVAVIGAPADAVHIRDTLQAKGRPVDDGVTVSVGTVKVRLDQDFVVDLDRQNVERAAAELRRPLLIAHAPRDELVGIDNATRLFLAAKHPKSFLSLGDADHLLTNPADAAFAAEVIAAWASRALPEAPPQPKATAEVPVVVRETGGGRYQNDVVVGRHRLLADEPTEVGGDDTGPSPYAYLTAALGACTSMTMRMYAERKGWSLDRVTVRLTHEKSHAEDCETCDETEKSRVDVFTRDIAIEGDLDAEQRQRLLEIADKCPVHRTLHAPVVVRTRLVKENEAQETP